MARLFRRGPIYYGRRVAQDIPELTHNEQPSSNALSKSMSFQITPRLSLIIDQPFSNSFVDQLLHDSPVDAPKSFDSQSVECLSDDSSLELEVGRNDDVVCHAPTSAAATSEPQHPSSLIAPPGTSEKDELRRLIRDSVQLDLQLSQTQSDVGRSVQEGSDDYLPHDHIADQLSQMGVIQVPNRIINPEEKMAQTMSSPTSSEGEQVVQSLILSRAVENINNTFAQALIIYEQRQSQWQAEMKRNEQLVKAIQDDVRDFETQAIADHELALEAQQRQRDEEERRRRELELEEQRRKQMEAGEIAMKADPIDCAVCGEECKTNLVYHFQCDHAYCRDCLTLTIEHALRSKSIFRCCANSLNLTTAALFLPTHTLQTYASLLQELDTPNPTYCSYNYCSKFIPPSAIQGGIGTCSRCSVQTCANCKKAKHAGVCKQDKNGRALIKLGKSKRWRNCPFCGNMVERSGGCPQMSCRCGNRFCYRCGKPLWPVNNCTWLCRRRW